MTPISSIRYVLCSPPACSRFCASAKASRNDVKALNSISPWARYENVTRDLNEEQAAKLIVAYEPVWAIGTGMVATPQSAQDAANAIRNDLKTTFGTKVSDSVRILYGGSVTSKNAAELISQPDVDGFLIGGAALDVEELAKIARLALKSTKSRN